MIQYQYYIYMQNIADLNKSLMRLILKNSQYLVDESVHVFAVYMRRSDFSDHNNPI
jgi:hypothetical protein